MPTPAAGAAVPLLVGEGVRAVLSGPRRAVYSSEEDASGDSVSVAESELVA